MSALLSADRLDLAIGDTIVCDALRLQIEAGQNWALLGPNGVGKSTLLLSLAGLRPPNAGELQVAGAPLGTLNAGARARRIAVLLQHSDPGFGASVRDTVLSGRHPHRQPLVAWETADDHAIVERCLRDTGLTGLAERSLLTLSGGELRRVEIARLLAQQCPLNLLDEPLNHLDFAHQAGVLRVLDRHCRDAHGALLMVLHDINTAYRYCDHWLLLGGDGDWHAGARETLAQPELLSRVFGHPIERLATPRGPVFMPQSAGTAC